MLWKIFVLNIIMLNSIMTLKVWGDLIIYKDTHLESDANKIIYNPIEEKT